MSESPSPLNDEARARLRDFAQKVDAATAQIVVGMQAAVQQFLIALLARGHVLLEGVPGTAKTTLAKSLAHALGIIYHRVQFTPDLLPADITGAFVFDRNANSFELRKGPLFCQLLLADEINRAPAKTQAALLEAMQEHQVTIEGSTLPLPEPFLVLATQNPVEQEGVYRLPEAQLDRFLLRVRIDYPERDTEIDILRLHGGQSENGVSPRRPGMPQPVADANQILTMQTYVSAVFVEPRLLQYIVDLARASRSHPDVALGASPRASIYLLQCAQARALLAGRHYATHEDVSAIAPAVLGHRLILRPEAEIEGIAVESVIRDLLTSLPVFSSRK